MLNYKKIMNLYFRKDFIRLCCCSLWLYVASKLPQRKKYLLSCLFSKEIIIYQVNLYPNLILLYLCKIQALDQLFSEICTEDHFFHIFNLIGWRVWICNCLKDVEFIVFSIWKVELAFYLSNLYLIEFGLHVHLPSSYYFLTFFKMKVL